MFEPGDVILAFVPFADSASAKQRPAVVLFEELGNIVVAGITSNPKMKGIPLTVKEGAVVDSVIKTNYIFTVSSEMVTKRMFSLSSEKKKAVYEALVSRLKQLNY